MADNSFKIVARLDIPASMPVIKDDIKSLSEQLKSDKNARAKIVAGLDIAKSKSLIQSQLATITNQANAPTIKVGVDVGQNNAVQGVVSGLKEVQTQAQVSTNNLTNLIDKFKQPIKPILNNEGLIDADKTIAKVQQHFQELGKVSVKGIYSDKEAVDSLDKMIISLKNGQQEARTLTFELDKAGKAFYLTGGTSDNSGIQKFIESTQKLQDKTKALRINLTSDLKSIRSAWQDVNGGKSVTSENNVAQLHQQYAKVNKAIRELRNTDATTMASMKANAQAEIATLRQMVTQFHNAEKVATDLRDKGYGTVKINTGNNIEKFISSINNSKVPVQALQKEIDKLTKDFAELDNIQDQASQSAGLTNILNTLDNAKSKFQSLKELFKGFGQNNWLSTNAEQINKLDIGTKVSVYREYLNSIKQSWGEFSKGTNIVANVNKELGKLGTRLGNIKTEKGFAKWSEDLNKVNAQISQMTTNLNRQVSAQNKINKLQAQIVKLDPTKDTAEISRLNEKLKLEQKELSNLQYQSNMFSNLISLAEQEKYITQQTVQTREKLASVNARNNDKSRMEQERISSQIQRNIAQTIQARQEEEKRQQLAQNNAINRNLEQEYAEREHIKIQIEQTRQKYTQLFSDLQHNTNKDILRGIEHPLVSFKETLDGLGTTTGIKDVENAFKHLQTSISDIRKIMTGGNGSVDKAIQQYNSWGATIEQASARIDRLKLSQLGLSSVNIKDLSSNLGSIQQKIKEVRQLENTTGKGISWAKQYREVNDEIKIFLQSLKTAEQISRTDRSINNQNQQKVLQAINKEYQKMATYKKAIANAKSEDEVAHYKQLLKQSGQIIANKKKELKAAELLTVEVRNQIKNYQELYNQNNKLLSIQNQQKVQSSFQSNLASEIKEVEKAIATLNKHQNSTLFKNNQNNPQVTAIQQQIADLTTRYQNMLNTLNKGNLTPTQFDALQKELRQLNTDFNSTQASATRFQQTLRSDNSADQLKQKVALLTAQIKAFRKANSKSEKGFGNQYDTLLTALANPNIDHNEYARLAKEFQILRQNVNAAGQAGKNFFQIMGEKIKKFAGWMTMTYVFSSITRSFRTLITNVTEIDSAMTSLKKVTNETADAYSNFLDNATKRAKSLGTTVKSLIDSTADFAKLGYSMNEAATLAEVASVYANVGELDIEDATSSIVSTMAAFGIEAENAIKIIDKFNAVGNNFSITSGDIGSALQRSASSLNASGNTLDEAIAMITAANTVVQDADVIGTAMKTVSLRLTSTSAQLEELGEDTEYACETISDYRNLVMGLTHNKVDILGDDGQYLSTYEIIKKLSEVWKELNSMEQSSLMKSLFGVRQANVGVSLIEQFDIAEKVLKESIESEGSAMEEHSRWLDSITAKTQQFKASFESLSMTSLDTEFAKGIVDAGTEILSTLEKIIETIGAIPTIGFGVALSSAIKSIGLFSSTARGAFIQYGQSLTALSSLSGTLATDTTALALTVSNLTPREQALALATHNVSQAQIKEVLALNNVEKEKMEQILLDTTRISQIKALTMANAQEIFTLQGLSKETAIAIMQSAGIIAADEGQVISKKQVNVAILQTRLAQEGLSHAQIKAITTQLGLQTSTSALSFYFAGLKASIVSAKMALDSFARSHPIITAITAIATTIGIAATAYKHFKEKAEEAKQEAKESALASIDSFESQTTSIKSLVNQYTEYIATTSDLTTVENELLNIQSQLTDIYGDEANQLDLLNKSYAENIALISKKNKEEAEQRLRENSKAYDEAENTLSADGYAKIKAVGKGGWSNTTKNNWESLGFDNIDTSYDNYVYITGTIEERIAALEAMYDVYAKQIEGLDNEDYRDRLHSIGTEINELKAIRDDAVALIAQKMKDQELLDEVSFFENTQNNDNYVELVNSLIEMNQRFNATTSTSEKIDLKNSFDEAINSLKQLTKGNSLAEDSVNSLISSMDSGFIQLQNNITSSATLYKDSLNSYIGDDGAFNTANDGIAKYTGALDDLSEKGVVTASVMNDLIELDSNLAGSFTKVGDGYHILTDTLIQSKDKLINKELEYARTEQKSSKQVIVDLKLQRQEIEKQIRETEEQQQKVAESTHLVKSYQQDKIKEYNIQLEDYKKQLEKIDSEMIEVTNATDQWGLVISQLNSNLGDTTSHLKELENQADALEDTIDKLEESIDKIESEISDLEDKQSELLEYQEYQIDNIINKIESEKEVLEKEKEVLEEQVTALEEQQEQLEELISNYEKVVDVISDVVDKQIEAIETERDAVEKHYDDIIEKLQEQNEEREKAITLAEKQANLENAQRNKIRQYNEQTGWTYVQDQEAIYNAQKELQDFKAQDEIDTLEKEKENALKGYDEQIEAWEEYVKLWKESVDSYSETEDNLIAEQILGSNWLEKIKNKDTTTLNTFKNNYTAYQNKLNTVIQREIDSLNQSIKAKEKDIEAKEKQIDSWNDYKNELSSYVESISNKWSDYVTMVGQVTLDENSSLEERASNLETFKNNYSAITDQILAKQGELTGMTAELESAQGTLEALQERINNYNAEQQTQKMNEISSKEIAVGNKFAELEYRQSIFSGSEVDAIAMNEIADEIRNLISEIADLYAELGMNYVPNWDTSALGGIPHYSTGGVNTTTGVSWLDGTPSKPELVLNNSQATKLWNLLNTMSSSQLAKIFRLDSLGQPPESLRQLANNSSMVTNNQNSQSINLIFNGNIIANNPVDFMQQMNSYVQHNKLNGWIHQG